MAFRLYKCKGGYVVINDDLALPPEAETTFGPTLKCARVDARYENLPEVWEQVYDEIETRSFAVISASEHDLMFATIRAEPDVVRDMRLTGISA